MSTPAEYYRSLPPVSKTMLATVLMTTTAYYLQLFDYMSISLDYGLIFKHYQVWRLFTNFIFLGPFSLPFAMEILMIYGVSVEKGPFDKRTADYVWMFIFGAMSLLVLSVVPYMRSYFLGTSLVFMIVYVWSRELPTQRINVYGLVHFKGFYLPYVMMGADFLLGNSLRPAVRGIFVGHLYYFLTVLYPLAGGRNIANFYPSHFMHKLVAYWGEGEQMNAPVQSSPYAGVAFQGRSRRLNDNTRRAATPEQQQPQTNAATQANAGGVAFQGRSQRLDRS